MAGFDEMGTGLFVIVLVINLFLVGFGGQELPTSFNKFVPDGNLSSSNFTNDQYGINDDSYAVPATTSGVTQNDPFGATVSFITQDGYNFILTILFGITIFALKAGAPMGLVIATIVPINVIFIFYLVDYIANKSPLKGLFGG